MSVMKFIDKWVHEEKSPVPLKEVVSHMEVLGTKEASTINAMNSLIKKGFIRRAVVTSNKSYYVMIRRVV